MKRRWIAMKGLMLGLGLTLLMSFPADAALINWTDWTSYVTGVSGSASGMMAPGISVRYNGEVTFAQTGTGTNYWTEYAPAPYTGNPVISNAPVPAEMIALSLTSTNNTITFSQPVLNPVMAIVSMGQGGLPVSYDFNQPFTVLSEGRGYWGDGWYNLLPGDVLQGYELHAAIQFSGYVQSISFNVSPAEYWHGITIGVPASTTPEPSTLLLLGGGLAGLGLWWRKNKKS